MNWRVYKKIVKRVLGKEKSAIEASMPMPPRTKLKPRVFTRFLARCDRILIPISEEVLAEERMRNAPMTVNNII